MKERVSNRLDIIKIELLGEWPRTVLACGDSSVVS
jgi:hypothetical protein